MLVVTEVFIAPPTLRDRKRELGEGGCFVQKGKERKKKEMKEAEVQKKKKKCEGSERLEEQQEGMFCSTKMLLENEARRTDRLTNSSECS